ncbi:hypothetical protein M407DRAFT_3567 [Tulasnella calospora MUT 4182]|uniref:RING-type E3 ubiquitin transferase n=1 Tax=Tulasnella calospora MUT 4182 TaxID=1051891 RepID=A0A0C3MK49_9AGAM|nr:hypothetical protein M407DRAFT_3567 [Tulasnella calospora MUT 4182]
MDDGNTDRLLDSDSEPEWGAEVRDAQVPGAFQPGAEEARGPANDPNVVNAPQPAPLQEAQPDAEPAAAARPEDELEGMVEDEVEGAMEAIGMRGPLIQLVQNWERRHYYLLPLLGSVPKFISPEVTERVTSVRQIVASVVSGAGSAATKSQVTPASSTRVPQVLANFVSEQLLPATQRLQHNITLVPIAATESAASFLESWTALVKGDGPRERGFAIAWGYLSTAIVLGTVLEWMGPNIGPTLRAIRSIIRQQVILIKVLVFITIELIIFPLGCGILLDLNTLPLFPSGTLQRRIAFLHYAPFTSIFLHWLLGTMSCRAAMRPGALWFIKDPSDPNFHPIRDILDRPTVTQMRKLGSSAMLYSGVLTLGIGSVLLAIRQNRFGPPESPLLPLRTSKLLRFSEPLSELPFDLIFLHIVAPVTLTRLRPKRVLRYLLDKWWRMASRQLRLSSFMFGKRYPEEEQYDTRSWLARLRPNSAPSHEFRGCLARAPATDALALSSDQPVLIQVNEKGEPQSERGAALMQSQNEACERAGLQVNDAFTTTYLPPHFKLRILYFTSYLWFFGTIVLLSCVAVPIYIGRGWVYAIGYTTIHDAYTWTIGLYNLIGCLLVWKEIKRLHRRGVPTPQRLLRNLIVNGACRAAMRPGALWFIKDPSDPNFHPIRDILDRPTVTQMRKLGSSAMLYSGVLTLGIGSVLLAIRQNRFGPPESPLLPLRTSKLLRFSEPLSELPFDLIFLHIVAPVTLTRLRPKRVLRYLLDKWWRMASRQLRLSSFMFGKRYPEEEQYDTRSWLARLRPNPAPSHEFRGCLARAPATDALALSSDQPVLIQVNEKGEPQSERGAALMQSQNEACDRAGLQVNDAFTTTYLPPHFKLRILYFTSYLWFFGTIVLLSCVAVPIYIGRGWVYAIGYTTIHDAYTWTIGLYNLIGCLLVWKEIKRLHRRGVPTPQRLLRNLIVNGGQVLYLLIMIGIVLPILVSMVVDFHVILPVRLWLGHVLKPELHLAESWAVGLIYIKMGMRVARVDGENELYQAWQRILLAGWRNPDAISATKDFIAPIGGPIIIMLVAPYLIINKAQSYYGLNDPLAPYYILSQSAMGTQQYSMLRPWL